MLTNDHPHAKLFERIYGPTKDGEGPALLEEAITEPFVAHTAGHGPIGGTFVGLDAFKGHIGLLRQLSGGTLRRTSIEYCADDQWAVVEQTMTASRNGRDLEMKVAGFWRFSGPDQLAEHWEAVSDEATWEAFWNTPAS
ncbi:nuclear transport factor 2 family protein [Streptomyces violaceusniger]|uniref:SnoaL-like domain-containing protein n=1 Tax=Streptomyces violaceusniger (strain Tu 4113) TaxID=653045 RepID=G2P854_STRV4|nr:nuclear transport factor 2 family protein [Streptomyces violaceusniger]AEM85855.1 hypothetical protein Strvi_6413 [Streptomyces violaceusniger Tu 4113]